MVPNDLEIRMKTDWAGYSGDCEASRDRRQPREETEPWEILMVGTIDPEKPCFRVPE